MAIKRSIETQQMLKVVAAVAWIHNTTITSTNKVWSDGRIKHLVVSHTGSTKIPTKKSATDSDAKKQLEIVRKDSFLKNSHNTIAFPVTATKLDEENHTDRQMDAALLRCLSGWLSFIVRWCTATAEKKRKWTWKCLKFSFPLYKQMLMKLNWFCMNHQIPFKQLRFLLTGTSFLSKGGKFLEKLCCCVGGRV